MARKDSLPNSVSSLTVTIANAATTSDAIETGGMNLVGIIFPPAFTGATITFTGSVDGTNYLTMKDTAGGS